MDFYRGDDRPPYDAILSIQGFTAKPPARTMSGSEARTFLNGLSGTPADIGMEWRRSTPGGLIATAMTQEGAYGHLSHFYKITIPDDEVTPCLLKRDKSLGANVQVSAALDTRDFFILFNKGNYESTDLIGFYYGRIHSKEVTFLTAIPACYISGFRQAKYTARLEVPFIPFKRLDGGPWRGPA